MKKTVILFVLVLFYGLPVAAQSASKTPPENNDSTLYEDDYDDTDSALLTPDDFERTLDNLTYSWAIDKNAKKNCIEKPNIETADDVYKKRLKKLPHIIEMPYNQAVKSFIDIFTVKRRQHVEYMLGLSNYYFPIFENALDAAGIPLELKYLPIIESALYPKAVSRSGAAGLWQFMIGTSRYFDMKVNSLVDERLDPIKSSKAAAKYLKELYGIYGDWNLVIAAYNCGPGTINRAIRRADGKRDFWAIYPYLPAETRAYVPVFIASNYIMNFYQEHNLCPVPSRLPVMTDTVMISQRLHLQQISTVLDISIDELRLLNPQYKKDIIPGDIEPYSVCLPINYTGVLVEKMNEVASYRAEDLINSRRDETVILPVQPFEQVSPRKSRHSHVRAATHTVKHGETLSGIAKKNGITLKQLKKINHLEGKSGKIKKGQKLKLNNK